MSNSTRFAKSSLVTGVLVACLLDATTNTPAWQIYIQITGFSVFAIAVKYVWSKS